MDEKCGFEKTPLTCDVRISWKTGNITMSKGHCLPLPVITFIQEMD